MPTFVVLTARDHPLMIGERSEKVMGVKRMKSCGMNILQHKT